MENKENNTKESSSTIDSSNIRTNHLVDIIMRQTDYSKEIASEKLNQHKQNVLSVIREYMSSSTSVEVKENENEKENSKSTSQLIYGEIRNMMGNACANYRRKKEMEEYKQAYIRSRMQAQMQAQSQSQMQAQMQAQSHSQTETQ